MAARAVGGAVARAFAREGAKVIVAARRREPQEQVVAAIRDAGGYAEATVAGCALTPMELRSISMVSWLATGR